MNTKAADLGKKSNEGKGTHRGIGVLSKSRRGLGLSDGGRRRALWEGCGGGSDTRIVNKMAVRGIGEAIVEGRRGQGGHGEQRRAALAHPLLAARCTENRDRVLDGRTAKAFEGWRSPSPSTTTAPPASPRPLLPSFPSHSLVATR